VPGNSLIAGRKYSFTALSKLPPRRRLGCALHLSRQKEASTFRASFLFSSIPRAFLFSVLVRHGISFETPAIFSHRDKKICAARRWEPLPLSTNQFLPLPFACLAATNDPPARARRLPSPVCRKLS